MSLNVFGKELFSYGAIEENSARLNIHHGNSSIVFYIALGLYLGLSIVFDDDDEPLGISVGLLFFKFTIGLNSTLTNWIWHRYLSKSKNSKWSAGSRMYSLMLTSARIEATLHYDDMGHSDVKGYQYSFWFEKFWDKTYDYVKTQELTVEEDPIDTTYGNTQLKKIVYKFTIEDRYVTIRSLGFKVLRRYDGRSGEIELLSHRLMFAGKGENSWDCEDDYTSTMSFPIEGMDDIKPADLGDYCLQRLIASSEENLHRYGIPNKLIVPII